MEGRSMLFAYETERLLLKIIKPDQADAVLDFYMRDKELFEKFEDAEFLYPPVPETDAPV